MGSQIFSPADMQIAHEDILRRGLLREAVPSLANRAFAPALCFGRDRVHFLDPRWNGNFSNAIAHGAQRASGVGAPAHAQGATLVSWHPVKGHTLLLHGGGKTVGFCCHLDFSPGKAGARVY